MDLALNLISFISLIILPSFARASKGIYIYCFVYTILFYSFYVIFYVCNQHVQVGQKLMHVVNVQARSQDFGRGGVKIDWLKNLCAIVPINSRNPTTQQYARPCVWTKNCLTYDLNKILTFHK